MKELIKYKYLYEKQICQCCGKEFYYTNKQISTRLKHLKNGENIIVACSRVCAMSLLNKSQDHIDKVKESCLKKYGVDNPLKCKEVQDKIKKSCLKKYGVENYFQTQDCKIKLEKARKEKYKLKPQVQINFQGLLDYLKTHSKATMQALEPYFNVQDVKDIMQSYNLTRDELRYRLHKDIPLDKIFTCKNCGKYIKFSKQNGYSDCCSIKCANVIKNKSQEHKDKIKQTYLDKYGVTTNLQLQSNINKSKQTCLKKYGVTSYLQSKEYRLRIPEIQNKIYSSKKLNNTFHVSKGEEKAYSILLTKFPKEDIERQYKSKLYPYQCDFYIKSLDLYIEYNGHWTHGKKPFDKNNKKHLDILVKWTRKANEINFKGEKKEQYKSAIYVWTILDPLKVKTAKENKLNYKVFWNLEEVKKFIKNI